MLDRLAEPGDLVQPGQAVLTLGNLNEIQVMVEVADTNRQDFGLGPTRPDHPRCPPRRKPSPAESPAFSPVADSASPAHSRGNYPDQFQQPHRQRHAGPSRPHQRQHQHHPGAPKAPSKPPKAPKTKLFVITPNRRHPPPSNPAPSQIGQTANNQVEILSGLSPGGSLRCPQAMGPLEAGQPGG